MNVNDRIALHMGWRTLEADLREKVPASVDAVYAENPSMRHFDSTHWLTPNGRPSDIPDYEHSLDALLAPLGVLRERGWDQWEIVYDVGNSEPEEDVLATIEGLGPDGRRLKARGSGHTPSEALALAVAEALEANQ